MNFLEKIENALNLLLIKLGELMLKSIPGPLKIFYNKLSDHLVWLCTNAKKFPGLTLKFILAFVSNSKTTALSFNFKAALQEAYKKAIQQAKASCPGLGKLGTLFLTPFLMMAQWLKGLSPAQSLVLILFTISSLLSVIGIGYSGQKLVNHQLDKYRSPASVEDEVKYDRPEYYKKQTRHFDVTNLRLPVYVAKVNELRSIDIDFTATLTNRQSRAFLEKHEFHLRDHLILQIEPSIATFPLEEEGKEIIRRKVLDEINAFLKLNEIDGQVIELKITYVLAN
jgi:flagellar basal body-associated protein FliL